MIRNRFILLLVFLFACSATVLLAQSSHNKSLQQLAEMPVAIDKAKQSGVPKKQLKKMTQAMKKGKAKPSHVNQTMNRISKASQNVQAIKKVGQFVTQQVKNGVTGEKLAKSIHSKLNSYGVPAGGHEGSGPPGVARQFIPSHAQKKANQSGKQGRARSARDRGPQKPGPSQAGQKTDRKPQNPRSKANKPSQPQQQQPSQSTGKPTPRSPSTQSGKTNQPKQGPSAVPNQKTGSRGSPRSTQHGPPGNLGPAQQSPGPTGGPNQQTGDRSTGGGAPAGRP